MPIRIFVTTDNHVGYNETDPVQGDDAAKSFDEAMTIAKAADVDFAIQGGDLFHLNKPSRRSMYSVIKTLRRTCLGDKPVEFEVLNHGPLAPNDAPEYNYPNFEDPNLNVAIPVFAISGNHDDAGGDVGSRMLSPLDVLSMTGLLNHFGRIYDSAEIHVKPILIEKAGIRVALYGMASVRDERLYRTFRDKKVKFLRPDTDPDSWYNILVVHQNHTAHGPTNHLPHEFLPNFVDLVIWGHEHQCIIDPLLDSNKGFLVMQPGSTVATSLHESETAAKHVAVLSIGANKSFSYEKIPLKTVRPFALRTVSLADQANINAEDRDARAKVTEWLMGQVEELIEEAKFTWNEQHGSQHGSQHDVEQPLLPLVRLRVDYTGYEVENTTRFSNRFVGLVANSSNVLHLIRHRQSTTRLGLKARTSGARNDGQVVDNIKQVGRLVHQFLSAESLDILRERAMEDALQRFVEKDEKTALKDSVDNIVSSKVTELLGPVNDLSLEDGPGVVNVPLQKEYAASHIPNIGPRSTSIQRAPPTRTSISDNVGQVAVEAEDGGSESEMFVSDSEEDNRRSRAPSLKAGSAVRRKHPPAVNKGTTRSTTSKRPSRAARSARPTFETQHSPPPYDDDDESEDMFSD